jgi:ubiquinone/menaquinone biosynthesis C-methylase UbiE
MTKKQKVDSPGQDISFYDDHPYDQFWIGRDYEHESETLALKKLIGDNHYQVALDYGGGYGRLATILMDYADEVVLADPSMELLNLAKVKLKGKSGIRTIHLKEDANIPLSSNTVDLVVMVRVSHHLAKPEKNFKEIYRVLKPNGVAIIEIANSAHMLNRIKYLTRFKLVPRQSIKVGNASNGILEDTPFFNHNVRTIQHMLRKCNFTIIRKLSVSNLRNQYLKKHFRLEQMVKVEQRLQGTLSYINFGPSMFIMVKKPE